MTLTDQPGIQSAGLVQEAWAHDRAILAAKAQTEGGFLLMGEHLAWMVDNEGWKYLGHESFEAYLASPDLSLQRTQAFKCMSVWRDSQLWDIPDDVRDELWIIGIEKLDLARRAIKAGGDPEEWLRRAKALGVSDLEEEVKGAGGSSAQQDDSQSDRETEDQLSTLLEEAVIQSVEFSRYVGLTLHVLADESPKVIRVYGRRGTAVEVRDEA